MPICFQKHWEYIFIVYMGDGPLYEVEDSFENVCEEMGYDDEWLQI